MQSASDESLREEVKFLSIPERITVTEMHGKELGLFLWEHRKAPSAAAFELQHRSTFDTLTGSFAAAAAAAAAADCGSGLGLLTSLPEEQIPCEDRTLVPTFDAALTTAAVLADADYDSDNAVAVAAAAAAAAAADIADKIVAVNSREDAV